MEKSNFLVAFKQLGIKRASCVINGIEEVYTFKKLLFYFEFDKCVVSGKIPLSVVEDIYKNYKEYGFSNLGGRPFVSPLAFAVDDSYVREIERFKKLGIGNMRLIQERLQKRSNSRKYISNLVLENEMALAIFIAELVNFYAKDNENLKVNVLENAIEMRVNIIFQLLKQAKLNISNREWLGFCYGKKYVNSVFKNNNEEMKDLLQEQLDIYDGAVNPFMSGIDMEKIVNLGDKLNVEVSIINNIKRVPKNISIDIVDKVDNVSGVRYFRNNCSINFMYLLRKQLGNNNSIEIAHLYQANSESILGIGEYVSINCFINGKAHNIIYNKTTGMIIVNNGLVSRITKEQELGIIDLIKIGIDCAEKIMTMNMEVKGNSKKLKI